MTIRTTPRTMGNALALALLLAATLAGQEEGEKVYSGPQKGERLLPFKVVGVWDDAAGKELDFVATAADKPTLLVFVHKLTRPSIGLTRLLVRYAADRGAERLFAGIVWLDDDRSKAEEYLTRARRSLSLAVPLGVSSDGAEGPGAYGLNRNVTLTVLVAAKGVVEANFALVQPSDTDAPAILAAIAAALGEEPPSPEEIARYAPRRAAAAASRGDRDARLGTLLRGLINRDNSAEESDNAARDIEAYVSGNRALQAQLGEIASRVVGSRIWHEGGYGNAAAKRHLRAWATRFARRAWF